jgi:hypothetical protein
MNNHANIAPRGLNIRQAAAYWGVCPNTYKKLYRAGLAPAPLKLPGSTATSLIGLSLTGRWMLAGSRERLPDDVSPHTNHA